MRFIRGIVLGALAVGLACGDDPSNAPPVPSAVTLASGNNQSALPGVQLPVPLTVTVTGTGSAPYPDVRVNWAVTTGSAALSAAVDTTDANGQSSTTVTIGTIPGNVVVTATVTGVTPVSFQATALNPCGITVPGVLTPLDTNGTANGVLTNFDCQLGGPYFTDFYRVVVPAQMGLQFSMTSVAYDTWLEQYHLSFPFIAVNDDYDDVDTTNLNSRIQIIAAAGTYVLAPSSTLPNRFGAYTLTAGMRPQTIAGCPLADRFLSWITRGVTFAEQVETTNCITIRPGNGRAYGERVLIAASSTRPLSVTVTSAAFNPRLELYELTNTPPDFRVLATAVNGTGTSATLNYTPTTTDRGYRLEITSVDTVQIGGYTLTVNGPAPNVSEAIVLPLGNAQFDRARPRATPGKARPN